MVPNKLPPVAPAEVAGVEPEVVVEVWGVPKLGNNPPVVAGAVVVVDVDAEDAAGAGVPKRDFCAGAGVGAVVVAGDEEVVVPCCSEGWEGFNKDRDGAGVVVVLPNKLGFSDGFSVAAPAEPGVPWSFAGVASLFRLKRLEGVEEVGWPNAEPDCCGCEAVFVFAIAVGVADGVLDVFAPKLLNGEAVLGFWDCWLPNKEGVPDGFWAPKSDDPEGVLDGGGPAGVVDKLLNKLLEVAGVVLPKELVVVVVAAVVVLESFRASPNDGFPCPKVAGCDGFGVDAPTPNILGVVDGELVLLWSDGFPKLNVDVLAPPKSGPEDFGAWALPNGELV